MKTNYSKLLNNILLEADSQFVIDLEKSFDTLRERKDVDGKLISEMINCINQLKKFIQ